MHEADATRAEDAALGVERDSRAEFDALWLLDLVLEETRRPPERLCGRNAVQISGEVRPIDLAKLQARLEPLGEVRANQYALRFFTSPYELTVFPDGRAIVKGTSDTGLARSLYARYVG